MATGKEIKARIKSVKNTGKITKAMELISTVKMKKAQDLAVHARPLSLEAARIFAHLDLAASNPTSFGKELVLIVSSNKGLCGGYNVNVFKEVTRLTRENPNTKFEFVTAGKRSRDFVARTGNVLLSDFSEVVKDTIHPADSKAVSRFLQNAFKDGSYDRVRVIYSHYISAINQRAVTKTLFPLSKTEITEFFDSLGIPTQTESTVTEYEFEPSKAMIIQEVLPLIYDLIVHEALLEGKASEHASRMIAMKNAKDSANKKVKLLTLTYNKARQAAITKEVSEIVSGVESMKD